MASYPGAPVVFPARSDGQTIYSAHINALQDEIAAIEASLVGGTLPSPQTIAGTRPMLVLDGGGAAKGRVLLPVASPIIQTVLGSNLSYDGANWNLDDTANLGQLFTMTNGLFYFQVAPAGANPRAPAISVVFLSDGSIRERGRLTAFGEWIPIAYNASDFSAAGGGTWTVDAGDFVGAYTLIGKTMIASYRLLTTTIAGVVNSVTVKLPGGFTPRGNADFGVVNLSATGITEIGILSSNTAGGGGIVISRQTGAAIPAGTNNTAFQFTMMLGIA